METFGLSQVYSMRPRPRFGMLASRPRIRAVRRRALELLGSKIACRSLKRDAHIASSCREVSISPASNNQPKTSHKIRNSRPVWELTNRKAVHCHLKADFIHPHQGTGSSPGPGLQHLMSTPVDMELITSERVPRQGPELEGTVSGGLHSNAIISLSSQTSSGGIPGPPERSKA